MITFVKAFGRFWYDFIIGDDWKIAAGVVLALAITLGLYKAGLPEQMVTVLGAVLVLAAFVTALVTDVRVTDVRVTDVRGTDVQGPDVQGSDVRGTDVRP